MAPTREVAAKKPEGLATENRILDTSLARAINTATRKLHTKNDAAVMAGIVAAAGDHRVYRQHVRDFYFVFKCFEEQWNSHIAYGTSYALAKAHIPALERTAAFEHDLEYYYGPDWEKTTLAEMPQHVKEYVEHIETISKQDPDLLLAYGFTFYNALFAGGRIVRNILEKRAKFLDVIGGSREKARPLGKRDSGCENATLGLEIFDPLPLSVRDDFAARLESRAAEDPSLMDKLPREALEIFRRNLIIIESVRGVGKFYARWAVWALIVALVAVATYKFYVVGLW